MKTKEEIRDWLLENAVDELGDLMLDHLDFSNFDGDVITSYMVVKESLYQDCQMVGKNLYQSCQDVGQDLEQSIQTVGRDYYCRNNDVGGKISEEPAKKLLKEVTLE